MILQAHAIRKRFSPQAFPLLDEVSLTLEQGSSLAILGKSGSGKTTLLHILGGLDVQFEGSVRIHGKLTTDEPDELRNQQVGFIFQSFHLLGDYSLIDNVLMPSRIARKRAKDLLPRAYALLERVGLQEKARTPVKLLSGGEKQRASLARAFCNDPSLIVADEPTGNLDPFHAQEVERLLLQSVRQQNKSLILVTHDASFAKQCDRVLLLKEGHLHPYS